MTLLEPGAPDAVVRDLRAAFARRYDREAAVVGRAPGRVNLIGEHTDYNAGLVLPIALPHATWAALAPREDDVVRLASAQADGTWEGRRADLAVRAGEAPDRPGWVGYAGGVLATLADLLPPGGADVLVTSTVPLGAGLSSSAAIECAVGVAALAAAGHDLGADPDLRERLVAAAVRAETEVVGAPTGGMDQTVAVHGRAGSALLVDFRSGERRLVPADVPGHAWLVTDTRVSHALIDGGYASRRADCERAAALLGVPSLREADAEAVEVLPEDLPRRRARHVVTEIARVERCVAALEEGDLAEVGRLMAASHASMRDDFEISCAELDAAVETALEAGAVGARMTGGGFGGSSVALVPAERLDAVVAAIDLRFVREGFTSPQHLVATPSDGASTDAG